MGLKTAGTGFFQIPTAPAALTAVAQSASANTLGSAVSFGNSPSAMYITGVTIGVATTQVPTYVQIQILVGASVVASVLVPYGVSAGAAASVLTGYRQIYPPIPVANAAAITVKSASSVASAVGWGVSLECIAQANVVDDGITVGTVNLVNTLTTYTGNTVQTGDSFARLGAPAGASVSADVAAVNAKTTNLPAAPASTTNITAGTITTVTNLTNAPTAGDLTATMKTSVTTAATVATPTAAAVTGAVGSVTGAVGSVTGAVGSVTGNVGGNVAGSVASVTAAVSVTGDLSATMKTSVTTACTASTPTAAAVTGAVGSVTGNVGGNVVGSVASVTAAVALTAGERNSVADALLGRNVAGGSSAGRLVKESLAFLRNKWTLAGTTLTVYDTDDTAVLWTATIARSAGDPVSSSDPA